MAAKLSQRFLSGIILCLFAGNLFAFNTGEIRGFDEKVFEYYFDRADREADISSWMREARQGIQLAIAGWETQALEFYADPDFRFEAGQDLIRWSEEELEKRYAQWLFKRFFGSTSGQMVKAVDNAVDAANRLYAYHTDDAGNIIYDETGAPESVRPAEGRSVEVDRMLWNDLVSRAGEETLRDYKQTITSVFPELLSYIDEENRSRFEALFSENLTSNILSRQAEFEALLAREERLFVARRTGDIWSLRKQSENQSAAMIISQLIRETEGSCALGIASLEERIEAAQAGTGDLALLGEEWLTAFQEQFDRGLKAWADAEERFIVRRMEWERDSGERFLEGEEAWRTAFAELEKERLVWENKAWEVFNNGEKLFIDVSEKLAAVINEVREDYKKDAALRSYSGAEKAKAYIDMYVTSANVLAEAVSSANFWLTEFVQGVPENALENGTLAAWVQAVLDSEDAATLTQKQKTAGRQLLFWAEMYNNYQKSGLEITETIEREFGLVLGMDIAALNAVLGSDSEEFFLDEYQVELLRAKAIAGYWEKRLDIAEAVYKYAEDLSAGRMTEAESLNEWRSAKASYDEALAAYENNQALLKAAERDLVEVRALMDSISAELDGEKRKLDELSRQYSLQIKEYMAETSVSVLNEMYSYYEALVEASGIRLQDDNYYTAYLMAEMKYAEEYVLKGSWALLETIVLNETDAEIKRLGLSLLGAVSSGDWYYAVSGKAETAEDRQALEAEGLYKRLAREAAEERDAEEARKTEETPGAEPVPELARKMLLVYQDLFSYAPGLRKEAAEYTLRFLSGVFSGFGISVADGTLPDIVSLGNQLLEYCQEKDKTPGSVIASLLADIYAEVNFFPMMIEAELSAWKDALIDYMAANVLYCGIDVPEDIEATFFEYESLIEDIHASLNRGEEVSESGARKAAFCQNLLEFLVSYDAYRDLIETKMEEGQSHWRSYVSTLCLETPGEEVSWEEGLLEDAIEAAAEAKRRIDAVFGLFLESVISEEQMEFVFCVESFLIDPEKAWEGSPYDSDDDSEYSAAEENYLNEAEKLRSKMTFEDYNKQQIAGVGFEISAMPPLGEVSLNEMGNISRELDKTKLSHQQLLNEYKDAASEYERLGDVYETCYGITKNLFLNLERARNEYEKQDAIQRWAGTSYLSQSSVLSGDLQYYREPLEELLYTKEQHKKAKSALDALQDLYNNGETKRDFADSEYMALYEKYRESFSEMFLTLKAKTEFDTALAELLARNNALYNVFQKSVSRFLPNSDQLSKRYDNYSTSTGDSWRDFIYITESGCLGVSRDKASFYLQQIDPNEAAALAGYFRQKESSDFDPNIMSAFETALISWTARMDSYSLSDSETYQTWGFALDYVFANLRKNNISVEAADNFSGPAYLGVDGDLNLNDIKLSDRLSKYYEQKIPGLQKTAWDSLDAGQQADLEFLAIMLMAWGGDKWSRGLGNVSKHKELSELYDTADWYSYIIWPFGVKVTCYHHPYIFDSSELYTVFGVLEPRVEQLNATIDSDRNASAFAFSELPANANAYLNSCDEIVKFIGRKDEGVEWADIAAILSLLEPLNEQEIATLGVYWSGMIAHNMNTGNNILYTTIAEALNALQAWKKDARETLEREIQNVYLAKEENRKANQEQYRILFDAYINGECGIDQLREAAALAYGPEAASLKKHYSNLGTAMLNDLKLLDTSRTIYVQQFQILGNQYVSLVESAYNARYDAELAFREVEWNEQKKDLNQKLAAWREAAGLILERGRQDWKTGFESMEAAYSKWERDFMERYAAVDDAWNAAYLESLQSKELWINDAVYAASESFNGNLLAVIGSDAESASRKLDGFMPSSFMDFADTEEASAILQGVLGSAGIVNLRSAVDSLTGSANTVLTQTKRGVSGLGVWNSGQAYAAAKELAWNSANELASGRMAILAFQAQETADEAKRYLEDLVVQSNKGFDANMDETYLIRGGWKRSGNSYIKDIVVHSTFFTSAITEKETEDVYKWFVLNPWDFSVRLNDADIENLDYTQMQNIAFRIQEEITRKNEEIFGAGDREGAFQKHIGDFSEDAPDQRTGEYGRLIYDFYQWEGKQAQGISLMNAALWDKPLWDSRGSWFDAPSIRTVVDIGTSVAATVVGAVLAPISAGGSLALAYGMNMTDDLIFGAMDVAGGHKDWDQVGFELGKKSLISAVTTAGGAAFSGVAGTGFTGLTNMVTTSTSGFATTLAQTSMAVSQAFTVGTVTSAIGAITYENGSFGWDGNVFKKGIEGVAIGAAVAGTSAFTSGAMNLGLEGFFGEKYANGAKLSSLIGGLAGQGVNYAFGGDITLNAFNLGFMNDNLANLGLLELHFGRDGFSSNLGSGGVDISARTLASAYKGLEAWGVNFDIWGSDSYSAKNYIKEMRSLYSGSETNRELYESILAGTTTIERNKDVDYTKTTHDPAGGKTITLGKDALDDGSRFGLSVVLSHESYRNGIDDGFEGQRLETNEAVMGHISTALGLMGTYGAGSIGAAMAGEAVGFVKNYQTYMSGDSSEEAKAQAMAGIMNTLYGYDASEDFWKLVKKDGKWGWKEDGSLDFNFDLTDPQVREAIFKATGSYNQTIKAEKMDADLLSTLGTWLGMKTSSNSGINDTLTNFIWGTKTFVNASLKARELMDNLNQKNINTFNAALMAVQKSGLLMENPVVKAAGLIGKGTDDEPYLPLTGNVAITCLAGWRFNADEKLGDGSNPNFPVDKFALQDHTGTDLKSNIYAVVASINGSLRLDYDNTFGLRSFLTSSTSNWGYNSNHLAPEAVMNYLAVFGMSGTSLSAGSDGQYMLNGLRAGVTLGTMGKTGTGTGIHLDYIIYDSTTNSRMKGFEQKNLFENLFRSRYSNSITVQGWANDFSGFEFPEDDDIIRAYKATLQKNGYALE